MMRTIVMFSLVLSLVLNGCNIKSNAKLYEHSITNIETIPNPFFVETEITEEIVRTMVELTTFITQKSEDGVIDQLTPKNESTTSVQITDMIEIINRYRTEQKIDPLKILQELCSVAIVRAEESSVLWSHTRPNGEKVNSLLDSKNINWEVVGENLARYDNASNQAIFDSWRNSKSHKANLMNEQFSFCGIAEYYDGARYYMAIIFTN